jgi:hypothetical protein
MVHVGVGDEDMRGLQELSCGERLQIPHVEKEPPPLEEKRDVEAGIAERIMDQSGMEERLHNAAFSPYFIF